MEPSSSVNSFYNYNYPKNYSLKVQDALIVLKDLNQVLLQGVRQAKPGRKWKAAVQAHQAFAKAVFRGVIKPSFRESLLQWKQIEELKRTYSLIQNFGSPFLGSLPKEVKHGILKNLKINDLFAVSEVNREAKSLALGHFFKRGHEFGYRGNDEKELRAYLRRFFKGIFIKDSLFFNSECVHRPYYNFSKSSYEDQCTILNRISKHPCLDRTQAENFEIFFFAKYLRLQLNRDFFAVSDYVFLPDYTRTCFSLMLGGRLSLMIALVRTEEEIADFTAEKRILKLRDGKNNTILHAAAYGGHVRVFEKLLEYRRDNVLEVALIRNEADEDVLKIALRLDHQALVAYLMQKFQNPIPYDELVKYYLRRRNISKIDSLLKKVQNDQSITCQIMRTLTLMADSGNYCAFDYLARKKRWNLSVVEGISK